MTLSATRVVLVSALTFGLGACSPTETAPRASASKAVGADVPITQVSLTPEILAGPKASYLFEARTEPTGGPAAVYGSYAKGCAAGLVELPETGPTWQAMRLSRNRNWGHPDVIDFVQDLSVQAAALPGWEGLYIGDLSQPRGGPTPKDHQSHQLGMEADIWMLNPQRLDLSVAERESISSKSIMTPDQRGVNSFWSDQHATLLRLAAEDPRVDRIFVTAPAKIALCQSATPADTPWLQKIRPYWGHHYHFHVRLKCPEGSPHCIPQTPTVAELSNGGNGCDSSLNWWVTARLDPPKTPKPAKPAPRRRGARDYVLAELPAQCSAVLAAQ